MSLCVNISIAIVVMVNNYVSSPGISGFNQTHSNFTSQHNLKQDKVYDWSPDTQGWILSAFYYGYSVFQIASGFVADRVGGKLLVGGGVLGSAVPTLLIPLAADLGASYVIALRVLAGLVESSILPAISAVWSEWAPTLERSRLLGIVYSGMYFGIFISLPISGAICYHVGWAYSFYIIGACGVVWSLLWFWIASDRPETHRSISAAEREYIIASLRGQVSPHEGDIPWLSIMKSAAVWAIIISYWGCDTFHYFLTTMLPTYMEEILRFDIQQTGLSSSIPFIASWLLVIFGGELADYLIKSQNFSTLAVRKGCIVSGLWISGIFIAVTGYVEDYKLTVAFVTISTATSAISESAIYVNCLDLTLKYSGIIFGITNTISITPGMLWPVIVKHVTQNHTIEEWRTVFGVIAALNVLCSLIYAIFGKAETQPWAAEEN
ncbi:sialin-like [Pristis pectinata]|uniref:sialin-like n=1 Tax=Pristis pectinata TaxID=685728 RepID=UPI00223CA674|nr:sialin-like [Pristis pectinata]